MEFRLFPYPEDDVLTPYILDNSKRGYSRYLSLEDQYELVTLIPSDRRVDIYGCDPEFVIGQHLPDRDKILDYLHANVPIHNPFIKFVQNTFVIPTFTPTLEEAFVKTVIRQVISAKQAKKIFSNFVVRYGFSKDGIYGFPSIERLNSLSPKDFREVGLGFKSERIIEGIQALRGKVCYENILRVKGIGIWSSAIIKMDMDKSYSSYPFWDISGEKAKKVCG